jgi:putative phosphoribosyl transferase
VFADRDQAGRVLAAAVVEHLGTLGLGGHPLVLALPRGGVPIGVQVARATDADLDVVVSRKIGAPWQPEFGIGALAEDGPPVFDQQSLVSLGLTEAALASTVERERAEVKRRILRYRGNRPAPVVTDRIVVVVDDGLATGVTAQAALCWVRQHHPAHLLVAAPVGSRQACQALAVVADAVICPSVPEWFSAVGQWYQDFRQLTDTDVERELAKAGTTDDL